MKENNNYIAYQVGPTEPDENLGPWFKDGKEWWVFNEEKGRYMPLVGGAS